MFSSLLRFELNYQRKQYAFIGFSFIFLAFGFLLGSQGYAPALVHFNSPYQIFFNIGIATISCEFVIMFFAVSGVLRDHKYQMESLIYSTSVAKPVFFWNRFLGVFMLSLLAFSMCLLGFFAGTFSPGLASSRLAPFDLETYCWVWLTLILPNVFICTSVIFSVAILSKNNVTTYVSAIMIYLLYWFCAMYFNSPLLARAVPASPENLLYAALADPFGLTAFFEQTQFWTPYQKNNLLISFSGFFMWNRVIWVSIAFIILGTTYRRFSFRKLHRKRKKVVKTLEKELITKQYQPVQSIILDTQATWQSFKSLLKIEFNHVFKSLPFWAVMLTWIIITVINIYSRISQGGVYNDSLYPTTGLLLALIRDPILSLILIVFYSGELVWRARDIRFHHILDATPISNKALFLSKTLVLLLLPYIIVSTGIFICIGFQLSLGYYQPEPTLYLGALYYQGTRFLFFTLLALFIQNLVTNKYWGMVFTGLIITFCATSFSRYLGINHPLLQLGRLPSISYSPMSGYSDLSFAFHMYLTHWSILGILLTMLSFKLWQRGSIKKLNYRLRQLFSHWKGWQQVGFITFVVLFLVTGSIIFYKLHFIGNYKSKEEQLSLRADYEKKYKKYDKLKKLALTAVKTKVAIFPAQRKYTVTADCILENPHQNPVQQVLLSEKVPLKRVFLENARLVAHDQSLQTRLFRLKTPLQPQQQLKFSYQLAVENKGFNTHKSIVANGSYILQHDFAPVLGYRQSLEITDNQQRKRKGLSKQKESIITDDHVVNHQPSVTVPIYFESVVSTDARQIAIAPGKLVKQWKTKGRSYFHYKAPQKIIDHLVYFSAQYAQKTTEYKGISIEQYYHPTHQYNIEAIQKNTQLTLDYCHKNFGAYPFNHLRIVEIPSHWPFGGQAFPGTISMVENKLYLLDNTSPTGFDLVAKRSIHEVAHQWWGILLTPKPAVGGSIFTEGFAKYTEAVIMEKKYGKRAIWQLSESAQQKYFSERAFATKTEPPLYLSNGESYLAYGKNYTVMLAIKELIGEEKLNLVLKNLLKKHQYDHRFRLTSSEFIDDLYQVTPSKYHALIDDWLKQVITYDLRINTVQVKKLPQGKYEIDLSVAARRFQTQQNGSLDTVSINEPIQIGVFSQHPQKVSSQEAVLYLKPHDISQDQMRFKIIVHKMPAYVSIDPFGTRLDKHRLDNTKPCASPK